MCETCKKQEIEKAYKALRLNTGLNSVPYNYEHDYDYGYGYGYGGSSNSPRLLGASDYRPTVHIKRLNLDPSPFNIKLRGASFIRKQKQSKIERENAEKALSLNCANFALV